ENDYLTPGSKPMQIVDTELGRIGLYSCMDGVIPETVRVGALQKPQLLLNSLNSCGCDEGELHIPVRAAENGTWVVAANKAFYDVPSVGRVFSGRSEVIAPSGDAVARANSNGDEEIVYAEIDLGNARGDAALAGRCHDAYRVLCEPNLVLPFYAEGREALPASRIRVAVLQAASIDHAKQLENGHGFDLVALPQRFSADLTELTALARSWRAYVGAGIVEAQGEAAVLISPDGELLLRSLPASHQHGFLCADTQLGRVGLMLGRDGIHPEAARVLACLGADIIVYPTTWTERWETELGVHERAAENHVTILAAARLDSPLAAGSILVPAVRREVVRGPNITLNRYEALTAPARVPYLLTSELDVAAARNKSVFYRTDVFAQRRPEHYGALAKAHAAAATIH
ncbi:MAG: hypothetical protein JOZ39_06360, partial [Chloroflexi bacterium]|nr:hypothetical protein [Chloroflexota bacterium]